MRRIKYLIVMAILTIGLVKLPINFMAANAAENCPALRVVFLRGSGGELGQTDDYLTFKTEIETHLAGTTLDYEFVDLDYPAIGLDFGVAVGAFFGAGEAFSFGESVYAGVDKLEDLVNNGCAETKYVIGGYSQGAMVVSRALSRLNPDKVIYAATFGDPKIYLPEGLGLVPPACFNIGLSSYREYVPDCFAFIGLLGGNIPYEPAGWNGKLGTWCNTHDIFCSSYVSISSHVSYVKDGVYEKAAETIFEKIRAAFDLEIAEEKSYHDIVYLAINDKSDRNVGEWSPTAAAKASAIEAIKLGKRVAVYYYDINTMGFSNVRRLCDFGECTTEEEILIAFSRLSSGQLALTVGGDVTMSALKKAITETGWETDAEKSLVVFSNSLFLEEDRLLATSAEVISASNAAGVKIFAGITTERYEDQWPGVMINRYNSLTSKTGGSLTIIDENEDWAEGLDDEVLHSVMPNDAAEASAFSLAAEAIVEEAELPTLEILETFVDGETVRVKFTNTGTRAAVVLNDALLGLNETGEVEISGLDRSRENVIFLTPMSETRRGMGVEVRIEAKSMEGSGEVGAPSEEVEPEAPDEPGQSEETKNPTESEGAGRIEEVETASPVIIPKPPKTGRR